MAIPEHAKCVAYHKHARLQKHEQHWVRFRKMRRKQGKLAYRERIRTIIDVQRSMCDKNTLKHWDCSSIREMRLKVYGHKHYRKYGKYDD